MATVDEWHSLSERLYAKAVDIFNGANIVETEAGTADPKVVGLTLLARTIGNFKAADILLDARQVVDARTIARCCYENLFWIAALAKNGDEFVKEMEIDDAVSRTRRANGLLKWSKGQPKELDFVESLEKFATTLKATHAKPNPIQHKQAAQDGGVGDGYIIYSELSNDSAHPSATSLSRHVLWHEGGGPRFSLTSAPITDPHEEEDTLELLCSAVLGVCIAANEIVGGTPGEERLDTLATEFRQLSASNAVARKAN